MSKTNTTSNIFVLIRRFFYLLLGSVDKLLGRKSNLVILCYHSIEDDGWRFSISPSVFKKQVEFMLEGYRHLELDNFVEDLKVGGGQPKPSFLLTFDDGYENLIDIAPFLREKGVNPILFVVSDREMANRESLKTHKDLLSDSQLRELADNGWYIGSHTKNHIELEDIPDIEVRAQVEDSKRELESVIGKEVKCISYPHGVYTSKIVKLVRDAGYECAFSMDDQLINGGVSEFSVPRVGVDSTHSFLEFKYLASPSVVLFRRLVRKVLPGRF